MFVFVIKEIRENRRITLLELAKLTKIEEKYLFELENDNIEDVNSDYLNRIAKALNVDIRKLYYTIADYEYLREKMHDEINLHGVDSLEARRISIILDKLFNIINKS